MYILSTHQREQNRFFATDILMNLHLYQFLNILLIIFYLLNIF